jgi:hypothetical protein
MGRTLRDLDFSVRHLFDGEATETGIVTALRELVTSGRPGDVLVFQYAGHGTFLPDIDGDEIEDQQDEALVPHDYQQGGSVVDDDLGAVYDLLPAGVNLTIFMDCCHSGSNNRLLLSGRDPESLAARGSVRRFMPPTREMLAAQKRRHAGRRGMTRGDRRRRGEAREVLFAACEPWESALEENGQGLFTGHATPLLAGAVAGGWSHAQLIEEIHYEFGDDPPQKPRLTANGRENEPILAPWGNPAGTRGGRGGVDAGRGRRGGDRRAAARDPGSARGRPVSADDTAGAAASPAVAAEAQSREADALEGPVSPSPQPGRYLLGDGIHRAGQIQPYRRRPGDPLYRRLRIFTSDPAESRLRGRVSEVAVPYEPLAPGPTGSIFEVSGVDGVTGERYRRSELDHPDTLLRGGYSPTTTDPRFHQQMVYAVATLVYDSFRRALGRDLSWGFDGSDEAGAKLLLSPHALAVENAFYDRAAGQVSFGYYRAEKDSRGRNLPAGTVFTCLCHDVVAHEVTHALLDGLRSHFLVPSHPDVLAFHEGFAHLVALFLRFSYREVVEAAVADGGGDVTSALLTDLGRQLGQTTRLGDSRWALVSAVVRSTGDGEGDDRAGLYQEGAEEHQNGAVLMSAIFEAFRTVYRRKSRRIVQLVTGGGRRELGPKTCVRRWSRRWPTSRASWRRSSARWRSAPSTTARRSTCGWASTCGRW